MIYVQLKGGLGNQMFQYAFGKALAHKNNTELVLDTQAYHHQKKGDTPRAYELHYFCVDERIADISEIKKYYSPWYTFLHKIQRLFTPDSTYVFRPQELARKNGAYCSGYWQSEKYFLEIRSTLLKTFTLRNSLSEKAQSFKNHIETIQKAGVATASLHVRRSDYVHLAAAANHHGALGIEYYTKALHVLHEALINNPSIHLFVFGDDVPWIQEHILPLIDAKFGPTSATIVSGAPLHHTEELYLQSLCDHHIIANSSFSWWGAWLSTKPGMTVAPLKWLANPLTKTDDVCPPSWIRI